MPIVGNEPDEIGAATSDHGWDLARDEQRLRPLIAEARTLGCRVSLFMDPDPSQMVLAAQLLVRRLGSDKSSESA